MTRAEEAREMRRGREGSVLPAALVAAALLAAWPAALSGQEAGRLDGDTLVLTLDDALRIAEANNPAYRRAVNEVGLNAVESRATWANEVLPRASLGLFNTSYSGNIQRIARDPFGNPIEDPQAEWVYFSGTTQSLGLSWSVQGASVVNAIRRQGLTNEGRYLAEDVALADLSEQLRRQFFDLLEQRELLEVEQAIAEARDADLELARREFRLARRSRVDVLNAELQVEQQALAVQEQRNTYERAKLALRTRLGDDGLGPFRLADEPLPLFEPAGLDAGSLVAGALASHPDVRQTESTVAREDLSVREARNAWWPDLNVGYNVYRRAQTRESDALFDLSFDEDLDQSFYVSLSVPFFDDYFGNRRTIEQAEVGLDNAGEDLRQTRLQVEEEVRSALLTLQSQHESLRLARRSLDIAGEALELARGEYRIGTRTFEQLQQSIEAEATARRNVITARYGFVDALLTLEEAVGAPVRGEPPVTDEPGADPDAGTGRAGRPGG